MKIPRGWVRAAIGITYSAALGMLVSGVIGGVAVLYWKRPDIVE